MKRRTHDQGRGGVWVAGQIVLMLATFVVGVMGRGQWASPVDVWIAGILTLAGAGFGLSGVRALGRNRTIFPEPTEQAVLIRSGVYARVRHPLYTSVMLLSLAWVFWMRSWLALISAVGLVVFLAFKSRAEEMRLLRRFPEYGRYRRTTKRFIPGLW